MDLKWREKNKNIFLSNNCFGYILDIILIDKIGIERETFGKEFILGFR